MLPFRERVARFADSAKLVKGTMKNATLNQTAQQPADSLIDPIKAKAEAIHAKVTAEINRLDSALQTLNAAIGDIGPLGMEVLARRVGESVNEQGRPAFAPWMAYTTVLASRKVDFKTTDRLHGLARKSVPENVKTDKADKFVKSKAKGSTEGGASCSLSMQKPVAWAIALGD